MRDACGVVYGEARGLHTVSGGEWRSPAIVRAFLRDLIFLWSFICLYLSYNFWWPASGGFDLTALGKRCSCTYSCHDQIWSNTLMMKQKKNLF